MNLSDVGMPQFKQTFGPLKAFAVTLFLLVAVAATGCSDDPAPDVLPTQAAGTPSAPTRSMRLTAQAVSLATQHPVTPGATALASTPAADGIVSGPFYTPTPVATTAAGACDLLTKEEVIEALGKPMEQVTYPETGRCLYQGDAEYLKVVVYGGLTEEDARSLYNTQWLNPNIPNGVQGGGMNIYGNERDIENLGDEAFIGAFSRGSARRLAFVRQGSTIFFIEWLTTVTDRDLNQVVEDLARLVLPRL
jgi:hypothetical protein